MSDGTQHVETDQRRPRRLAVTVVIAAIIIVAGALFVRGQLELGDAVAGVTEVAVLDDSFDPPVIEIPAGTQVTWSWRGRNDHNVVGHGFESPLQAAGDFTHTFTEPGTFDYECTLHAPFMRGRVVVTATSAVSAAPAVN